MLVALVLDQPEWHARALRAAFARAGADTVAVRLAECGFDSTMRHGLALPGLGESLPDGVLVRGIGAGSFEEITCRLGILHALGQAGVPIWNDARAIERCVDKSTTTHLAAQSGLAVPDTWTAQGLEAARAVVLREGGGLILKPLFGAQGRGLRRIESAQDLPAPAEVGGVYYLQRYVGAPQGPFQDHRLLVIDGDVAAAMTRHGRTWITNIRQGGRAEALAPDSDMRGLAVRAAACVGARYAGVDILRDRNGRLVLLEVNSMPAWRGVQQVTACRIADRIVGAFLASLA